MLHRTSPFGLALLLVACAEPPREVVEDPPLTFVVSRLYLDPATLIGDFVRQSPTGPMFEESLGGLNCHGNTVLALELAGDFDNPDVLSRVSLLVATNSGANDLCDGDGEVLIQPVSFMPGTDRPWLTGPLLIGGRTIDGQLPIGSLNILGATPLEMFPTWWRVSATFSTPIDSAEPQLTDASVRTVWRARQLHTEMAGELAATTDFDGYSALEFIVLNGLQPDLDVDGDGLEELTDTDGDGHIDRCRDGSVNGDNPPTVFEGTDCPLRPEIADGYDLRLVFRLVPTQVTR